MTFIDVCFVYHGWIYVIRYCIDQLKWCHFTESGIASGHIPWEHESIPKNLKKCSNPCVVCQLAKSQRRTFNNPLRPVYVPGQHTYLDLYGPIECESLIDGSLYCAGFIDAFSSHL